jgi:tRNA G10  N-methylase Trm11
MTFLLFVGLGNTLAESEVEARIGSFTNFSTNAYSFEAPDIDDAIRQVSLLGSSIKLAVRMDGVSSDPESISEKISHKNFSITQINTSLDSFKLCHDIKVFLPHSRFVLASDSFGLSPIISTKHKVDEFFVDDKGVVWKTVWVHDFRHWIKKDRHMPFSNAKSGMLPPKIARCLVNLVPSHNYGSGKNLVDPFCGSGRVLVEAGQLGFKVFGSDTSASQAKETKENLNFVGIESEVQVLDATHLSDKFNGNIDAIVTEPFMGKPSPRPDKIKYLVPGLTKLYHGCLKNWHSCLKEKGTIVMIFPVFNDGKKDYKTSSLIDEKLSLSYNLLKRDLYYSRPGATLTREIVVLEKK